MFVVLSRRRRLGCRRGVLVGRRRRREVGQGPVGEVGVDLVVFVDVAVVFARALELVLACRAIKGHGSRAVISTHVACLLLQHFLRSSIEGGQGLGPCFGGLAARVFAAVSFADSFERVPWASSGGAGVPKYRQTQSRADVSSRSQG